MKLENLVLDIKNGYGEVRFFGLEKENFAYDNINKRYSNVLESRVYKVLSMEQGEMLEVTIPTSVKSDVLTLDKNAVVELVNPRLTVTGSVVTKEKFNSVNLKPLLQVDDILLANVVKGNPKQQG